MTAPVTPADLSALSALEAKATPGPWTCDSFTVMPSEGVIQARCDEGCDDGCDDQGEIEVGRICAQHAHSKETICDVYGLEEFAAADAAFIAAARTAVPSLLAHVAAQADRIEALEGALKEVLGLNRLRCAEVMRGHDPCTQGWPDTAKCVVCRARRVLGGKEGT